jgi:hypothetical protein
MTSTVTSPNGKTLHRRATHTTTPKESAETKVILVQMAQQKRVEENRECLKNANVKAFLAMIGKSEGGDYHAKYGSSPDDKVIDRRFYPPDPDEVDASKLPRVAMGLKPGMPFFSARRVILRSSWRPLDMKRPWTASEEPDCGLLECELHRRGVIELEGCPTDRPVCIFYYRKSSSWLQVMTLAEALNDIRVYYWNLQAPEHTTPR